MEVNLSNSPPYLNDALRWVAAEVRYPLVEQLAAGSPSAFREQIHKTFPVHEEQNELSVTLGATGPGTQQVVKQRFLTRDRLTSITLGRDAITLETTEYHGWSAFRDQFAEVLAALENAGQPDGILRVGLRYIDEIRVPQRIETVADWQGWIDERLLSGFTIDANELPRNATIVLQYGDAPGHVTVFRASPVASGRTVQSEGPPRMPFETPEGPYFLLDTDASWADPDRQVPEFQVDRIIQILTELHEPASRLFENSITERLRTDVLSRPREEVWS